MAETFPNTPQQDAFLVALLNTTANLALVARAGCGKTSTIMIAAKAVADAAKAAGNRVEILVLAYNKANAKEAEQRLVESGLNDWRTAQASTLHALGFSLLKFHYRLTRDSIDDKKVQKLVASSNNEIAAKYGPQVVSLVCYAKQAGVGFFADLPIGNVQVWHDLAAHYDINGLDETDEAEEIVDAAIAIYKASLAQTDVIDFDDMILFPLIKNIRVKFGKDLIFLDEAQDLSRSRQALARKFLKTGSGRMVVVGDDRQAIYGFSGADSAALDNLIKGLNATVLPLSVTWRCPKAVVRLAQTIVPDIEAAASAREGEVIYLQELPEDLRRTDAILCRNTAPLIPMAYSLIRRGIPCKVEGRQIGDGLINLAQRWKIKTIDALLNRLDDYLERELQKAAAKGEEEKAEVKTDTVNTLREIAQQCLLEDRKTVGDVVEFIERLFADDVSGVLTLCTYHRSKGREWPRVLLFEHNKRCPSKGARQDWQMVQEDNLAYVAFTRAQQTLAFIN